MIANKTNGIIALRLTCISLICWVSPCQARDTDGDFICGPRCVSFLLEYYGRPSPELIELVKALQWPRLEQGASLASIERELNQRGVYTFALKVGKEARIVWPEPVLVHLKGDAAGGHYVVLLPPNKGVNDKVWVGLGGFRVGPSRDLARRRSGYLLLTSKKPIVDPMKSVASMDGLSFPTCNFVASLGCLTVIAFAVIVSILRRASAQRWSSLASWY